MPKTPEKQRVQRREALRKWRANNPERASAHNTKSHTKHRKKRTIESAAWRRAHPERCRIYSSKYSKLHPEVGVASINRYRAKKKAAKINDLSTAQWVEIQGAQRHRCAYCYKKCKLTQDHLTPIDRGGSHTLHNVIGACRTCNSKKGNRNVLFPIQPLLLTIAKPKIHGTLKALTSGPSVTGEAR